MVMVSIWTMYLGAVALFNPTEVTPEDGDTRSAQRSDLSDQGEKLSLSLPTRDGAEGSTGTERLDSGSCENSHTHGGSGQKGNKIPKPRLAAVSAKDQNPAKPALGPANSGNIPLKRSVNPSGADATTILRATIIDKAVALALNTDKPWRNLIAVAMEQYRRGEKEDARAILRMAEKMAADPDDPLDSSMAVRDVVKAMLAQHQTDDAIQALQNIQNTRERERAVAEVAAWSARIGNVALARSLLIRIVNASERDVALVSIAESEASYEGVATALQTVGLITDAGKKDEAYRRIAMKRGEVNDFSAANQAVQLIRNDQIKNAALASLARLRAKSGDVSGSLLTLRNVNDQVLADTSLRELASELARLGKFSTSAYVTTRILNEQERSCALENLSIEQARSGDLSGSLVRTSAIPIHSVRERALSSVSSVTAGQGSPARARNVAIRIDSNRERDRAYRAIAQAAAADGDHVTAYNTLQDINLPDEKALALVSMARTRQQQGDKRQALAMLEDANRETVNIQSATMVDRIKSGIAVAYAERQESAHSLHVADNISDLRCRDNTYSSLARALAGSDIQAAQLSVQSIASEQVRMSAEDVVARTLAKDVKPQEALDNVGALNSGRQQIVFLLEVSRKT